MFKVCLVSQDRAGGLILGGGQDFVKVDGLPIAVLGDAVENHDQHQNVRMIEGSPFFKINGLPVCRENHRASCNHTATGSATLKISQ